MISSSDLPACPACGCRDVHPVTQADGSTLYACRQCGRDNSQAWAEVQPAPEPEPVIGDSSVPHGTTPSQETIFEATMRLGIAATIERELRS